MLNIKSLIVIAISCLSFNVMATSDIYIYPNKGQTHEQQSLDRYECHVWAANQSGFDPSAYYSTSPGPVRVASVSGGRYPHHHDLDPITGAAGGAALGALGGAIGGNAGKGAAIGAGVGALAGIFSAAGNHRHKKDRYIQQQAQQAQQAAEFAQDQANYKRAIGACLEAHDYTVK